MHLETLKVFCDVVRTRSFSRGAAANHISQSAASQAVQQLEQHLGVRLIDRTRRPFVLTPEGADFHEGVRQVVELYDEVEARVRALREEVAGTVRVVTIYSVGLYAMRRCMQEFMARHPKARVRLEYLRAGRVYEAVREGEADLGVVAYPSPPRGLAVIPLGSENMVVICPPGHRLARIPKVTVGQLAGESFVAFDRDTAVRRELDRFLRQHHVSVQVVMEFDNIETIKQAVEIGAGISIVPEPTVVREAARGELAAVPLAVHPLRRPIGLVHRQRKVFTPAAARFVALLRRLNGDPRGVQAC